MALSEKQLMKLLHEENLINEALKSERGNASKALLDRLNVRLARIQEVKDEYKHDKKNGKEYEVLIENGAKFFESLEKDEKHREYIKKTVVDVVKEYTTQVETINKRKIRESQKNLEAITSDYQDKFSKQWRKNREMELLEDYIGEDGVLRAVPDRVLEKYMRGNVLKLPKGIKPRSIEALFEASSDLRRKVERIDNLPNTVTVIGQGVFQGCSNLRMLELPPTLNIIGKEAIADCPSLKEVYMPASVNMIGQGAFRNSHINRIVITPASPSQDSKVKAKSLVDIYVPEAITESMEGAFVGCTIKEFRVGMDNTQYSAINGDLYDKSGKTLIAYANGKKDEEIIINDKVERIAISAFNGAKNLKNIVLGKNIKVIGKEAFAELGDENLEGKKVDRKLDMSKTEDLIVEESAFKDSNLTEAKGMDKVKEFHRESFAGNKNLKGVLVTNAELIDDEAFRETGFDTARIMGDNAHLGSKIFANSQIKNLILDNIPIDMAQDAFYEMFELIFADMPMGMFLDKNGKVLSGAPLLSTLSKYFRDSKHFEKLCLHAQEKNIQFVPATMKDRRGRERSWFMAVSQEQYTEMQETGKTCVYIDNSEGKREVSYLSPKAINEETDVETLEDKSVVEQRGDRPDIAEEDRQGLVAPIVMTVDLQEDGSAVVTDFDGQILADESSLEEAPEAEEQLTQEKADAITDAYAVKTEMADEVPVEETVQTLVQRRDNGSNN